MNYATKIKNKYDTEIKSNTLFYRIVWIQLALQEGNVGCELYLYLPVAGWKLTWWGNIKGIRDGVWSIRFVRPVAKINDCSKRYCDKS